MWVFIYGVGFPVSFGFFTACCCVYGVTEWDPILFFGFLWMQMKICIVLYVLFWYSIYFFLLHSTCSMKSLLDLISDDWIQFFPPSYCDKSKWQWIWIKKIQGWSLEDISMVKKMNYEPNARQLIVLHSMYIFSFFMAMQLAGRFLNTTPIASLPNTSISWYPILS